MIEHHRGAWSVFDLLSLAGGHREQEGYAVVFACYLDDSDDKNSLVATLAGYVATIENWRAFEVEAEPIFERYGVDILHTKDLHNTRGEFKGWTYLKKSSFVEELYDAASKYVPFGAAVSARKSLIKKWKRERPKNSQVSPHGFCFGSIMHLVVHNHTLRDEVRRQKVSFLVESGHNNNGEIERYFHKWKADRMYRDYVGSISFVGKRDSRAIQLADFFAFHARRTSHRLERFDNKLVFPEFPLFAIAQMKLPHSMQTASKNLRETTREDAMNPELSRRGPL